ncbi:hypothetical protein OG241_33770 [Streptomyces sp. NBC_01390]|uniref:hypothetical protein n=1 Tax=Streptomyces sp. NBC_01390 TaxID=2903850 RepID=UPI00325218DE
MTQQSSSNLSCPDNELGSEPFRPRLGDLARDIAREGQIGVVVALPGEGRRTYHLRPPGGGTEWSAAADGTTLAPVPAKITHVTPESRELAYDQRAQQGALSVRIHYEDGGTTETLFILTTDQLHLYGSQFTRFHKRHDKNAGGSS